MNKSIQNIISTIFHPIFVNLLGMGLLFLLFPQLYFGIPLKLKYVLIAYVFFLTGIVPLMYVLFLKFSNKVTSIHLNKKEERFLPYLLTTGLYLFCYYSFYKIGVPNILLYYLLGCFFILLFVLITNYFYKISLHTTTLGALFGVILYATKHTGTDLRMLLTLVLVVSGLVASARMFANAHTLPQIYLGFFAGASLMYLVL
jgi:hypothetical protein